MSRLIVLIKGIPKYELQPVEDMIRRAIENIDDTTFIYSANPNLQIDIIKVPSENFFINESEFETRVRNLIQRNLKR